MKVKIVGIAGSLRKGNTDILLNECLKAARELKEVETEFIRLIFPATALGLTGENKPFSAGGARSRRLQSQTLMISEIGKYAHN